MLPQGVEIGAVSSNPWQNSPSEYKPPSKQILLHSAKLPLDCRHRGRKRRELGGQEEELRRSRGVLALIAFPDGKSFFTLFKKDLHMYARLEKQKALCHTISLEHC